ncbi:MAG TPA: AsmA-like C-terminal region-containing protein [Isosphaeraceae bacterium]|jgi:translocation and assembly module TamB|nr:AsmA-like C-terminal region-containing protein [Isosphaeraceae bacterium]
MRIRRKTWAMLGIGAVAVVAAAVLVVRAWVVPAVIVRQIEARYGGKVRVRSWWLGRNSSGINGLELHEGPGADSPVWAKAERVETDLSLGDLLHGRTSPARLVVDRPNVTLRLSRDNHFLTDIPIRSGGASGGGLPPIEARDATLTFRQEGRPEFTIHHINASLAPEAGGDSAATAHADDPVWGPVSASGRFAPGFATGRFDLDAGRIPADPGKAASVPYVPPTVWKHVEPTGPLAVRLNLGFGGKDGVTYRVEVASRGATLALPKLDVAARDTAGSMVYDSEVATLKHVRGDSLGGRLDVDGTLDFNPVPARFALALRLETIDVAQTPRSWRLGDAGITGRLTGRADLRMALRPEGVDLNGTTGHATVKDATVEGIPAKAVRLDLEGTGGDLKYESESDCGLRNSDFGILRAVYREPNPDTLRIAQGGASSPQSAIRDPQSKQSERSVGRDGVIMPKSITTRVELDDVDLRDVVKRAEKSGVKVPVEVRGLASVKAVVTVPLGALKSLRDYRLKGTVTLDDLSVGGVRPGPLRAWVDLDRGVLALNDLTGRLVDSKDGKSVDGQVSDETPHDSRTLADATPLPPGGFRVDLRAELDPAGKLSAKVEGRALPLARLAAAAATRNVAGLAGAVDVRAVAEGDLEHASDPKAWTVRGKVRGDRLAIERLTLDRVAADVRLADGRLTLDPIAADLDRQPLRASVTAETSEPFAFEAKLDVADWDVARLASAVPALARGPELAGRFRAKGTAEGTLQPREVRTRGEGLLRGARAGDVDVGDVPFAWRTEGETIRLRIDRARVFGGTLAGEATVPAGGGTIEGRAAVADIDLGEVTRVATGGGFPMAGRAGGTVRFRIPEHPEDEGADGILDADLTAPDLTVRGTTATELTAKARLRRGVVSCEVNAKGLGGTLSASGTAPVSALNGGRAGSLAGDLRARNIRIEGLWPALGLARPLGPLHGLANFAVDVRPSAVKAASSRSVPVVTGGFGLGALTWGRNWPLGRVQGRFSYGPEGWQLGLVNASLFEGETTGSIRGTTDANGVSRATFRADIERARLHQVLAVAPLLGGGFEGFGSIHITGQVDGSVHADAALDIGAARVFRIPLARLEVPATLDYAPDVGSGTLRIPRWSARVAGGRAWGTGLLRLGADSRHAGTIEFAALDLETLARAAAFPGSRASGKLNGKISWTGKDPSRFRQLRGVVDLDLDDAELFEMPVLRQIGQFLGASQSGVFNDGDLHGVLDDDRLIVEDCTLAGRLVQLHATGTVGFDGRLDLMVVVNTSQIITETGQALLNLIPGLRRQGRRPEVLDRFGGFLSNRLLKFRVTGTVSHPSVNADPTVLVTEGAVNFFADVLKLPFNLLR